MKSSRPWPPIRIVDFQHDEEGNVYFEFDFGLDFELWFKEEQGLKRWSQKRFNEWTLENINELLSDQGLI